MSDAEHPVDVESGEAETGEEAQDDRDMRIAQLEFENAQLRGQNEALTEQLLDQPAASAQAPDVAPPPLVGDDWSHMTSAQAKAHGVTRTVLCSDGYYVPNGIG